jgi:hypothetical protein
MSTLKQLLVPRYNLKITKKQYDQMKSQMQNFELREAHPMALNSPLLGVEKIHFYNTDQQALFDIFNVDKAEFVKLAHQADEIDTTRKVTSDGYNLLTIWIAHLVMKSKLSRSIKEDFLFTLFKMMIYRFFTGVVNYNFPHGAELGTMTATIDGLSAKFDIKSRETPTWKLVIEERARDIYDRKSIHYRRLETFSKVSTQPVIYIISDAQTRIRVKLRNIINIYYVNHAKGVRVGNVAIAEDIGGEKVINNIVSNFDMMIENIANRALNVNRWISHEDINLVAKLSKNLRPDLLKSLLIKYSDVAVQQHRHKQQSDVEGKGNFQIITGYREFITWVIQKTYRAAIMSGDVDMKSRPKILEKTRNLYRSSRISDQDILIIKNSAEDFVNKYSDSKRTSTNASLKIALITYIILLSFKSM